MAFKLAKWKRVIFDWKQTTMWYIHAKKKNCILGPLKIDSGCSSKNLHSWKVMSHVALFYGHLKTSQWIWKHNISVTLRFKVPELA